jgi:hypothetical protein
MHRADRNFVTLLAAAFGPAFPIAFLALPPSG